MERDLEKVIGSVKQMHDRAAEELVPRTLGEMVERLFDMGTDISTGALLQALLERAHSHPDEERQLRAAARRLGWTSGGGGDSGNL